MNNVESRVQVHRILEKSVIKFFFLQLTMVNELHFKFSEFGVRRLRFKPWVNIMERALKII